MKATQGSGQPAQIVFSQRHADGLVHALRGLGLEVLTDSHHRANPARTVAWWPDFYALIKSPWQARRLRSQCTAQGIALVTWNRDAPNYKRVKLGRLWAMRLASPYHIYWSHLTHEPYRFGDVHATLGNAADLRWFNLGDRSLESFRDRDAYQHTVSFVGGLNAAKYKDHYERSLWMAELRVRLQREAISHLFIDTSDRSMHPSEMRTIIQSSVLNLSVGAVCEFMPRFHARGLPERPFGVGACGGAYLSDRREIDGFFDSEHEWMDFADLEHAMHWARTAPDRLAEIRDHAEAMHRKVLAEHTYHHRARQVVTQLAQWHQQAGHLHKAQSLTRLLEP